ncbi:MAG: D-alanyl-D-alanine carboxypeptidase/D-alanyl-D-alanine-endopeptidase [Candidatus Kapaibacterium sp.]
MLFLFQRLFYPLFILGILSCITTSLFAQEQEVDEHEVETKGERVVANDSASNLKQLVSNITTILTTKHLKDAKYGISIYSLDKKKTIFEKNSHEPLTPASTTKLFYTSAAFQTLGSNYRIPTKVYTEGQITKDGTLTGNLYICGYGDCLLTVADVEQLADQLHQLGIKSINGEVIADGTFFDNVTDRQAYSGDAERMQPLPPITALGINRNLVTVIVSSAGSGTRKVQTIPPSDAFSFSDNVPKDVKADSKDEDSDSEPSSTTKQPENPKDKIIPNRIPVATKKAIVPKPSKKQQLATKKAKPALKAKTKVKKKKIGSIYTPSTLDNVVNIPLYDDTQLYGDYMIKVKPKAKASGKEKTKAASGKKGKGKRGRAARVPKCSVSSYMTADGVQRFSVSGTPPANSTRSFTFEIKNPPLIVAGVLYRSLKANGIQIRGGVKTGTKPQNAKQLTEFSRPLFDLVSIVNKNSDNYIAEHVMKIVGANCCGNDKCNINAYKTVSSIMDSANIPLDGCMLYDGSGLSRKNKTSAATQVNLLRNINSQPYNGVFYNTMAIAGVDGTLHRRMKNTNAAGNVHAKTGTHSNVSALSGYVRTKDGERIAFSMIWNGWSVGVYKQLENLIAIQLAEFSYTGGTVPAPVLKY